MLLPLVALLALLRLRACVAEIANYNADLVGTWTSKSETVFTGPSFFDPTNEDFYEPDLPGISYSFTEDGHYEEAIYVVTANASTPSCPTGVLQFQHGTYAISDSGNMTLTPYYDDGRQLLSDPCSDSQYSTYTEYSQTEVMSEFYVAMDTYHGRYKLQLYQWDGTPMQPMYLAYRPPMMLPTQHFSTTSNKKRKWPVEGPSQWALFVQKHSKGIRWLGLGFIAFGSVGFLLVS
ncbi:ER chaperone Rot1 [Schizosaccharomyces japonicus yFS275]|uniref:Protein ROT1 n=1 Tax=Schizosaccharomyces japonicus (strain yFS275 / FY16936) TaxID=402676 RepID=B6JVT7_SCHJY|nr:ER chaperone Rot1 [Schizosaccharomyces japonicus yFS275]EEB05488.1 ER chaperone Rot1 [Schizosaccharomyces japonicus yFS275]